MESETLSWSGNNVEVHWIKAKFDIFGLECRQVVDNFSDVYLTKNLQTCDNCQGNISFWENITELNFYLSTCFTCPCPKIRTFWILSVHEISNLRENLKKPHRWRDKRENFFLQLFFLLFPQGKLSFHRLTNKHILKGARRKSEFCSNMLGLVDFWFLLV